MASAVVLSIGMDPSFAIWRARVSDVPAEFRTVSLSASNVTLLLLLVYGLVSRRQAKPIENTNTWRAIALSGSVLVGCLVISAFAATALQLSIARTGDVVLGLLGCLLLARRPSLSNRLLVCGTGLILLQLPQLIIQEVSQTSVSLGSLIPGWPPTTPARASGALVVLGPGDLRWQRGMGSFLHPNLLGGFLALWVVLSLPLLARRGTTGLIVRSAWWIAWGELLLTFSRAALLAAIVGCVWWECTNGGLVQQIRRFPAIWGVPVVASVVFVTVLHQIAVPRLDPATALKGVAITARLTLLHTGLRLIGAHPWVGVGAGNYSLAEARLPLAAMQVQPVHVVPLLVAAESGVIAGLAWMGLVLGVPLAEWRGCVIELNHRYQRFAVPIVLLLLASLDHYFWSYSSGQALFWITLGIWASRADIGTVPRHDVPPE